MLKFILILASVFGLALSTPQVTLKLVHGVDDSAHVTKEVFGSNRFMEKYYEFNVTNPSGKPNLQLTNAFAVDVDEDNVYSSNVDKSFWTSLSAAKLALVQSTDKLGANPNTLDQFQVPAKFCPYVRPMCDRAYRYRMIDGSCNNVESPTSGMSRSPFKRMLNPIYEDGVNEPRRRSFFNRVLPNPRQLAMVLHDPVEKSVPTEYSNLIPHFNEFVHFDLGFIAPSLDEFARPLRCSCLSSDEQQNCFNIQIPSDDRVNKDQQCMTMARSSGTFRRTSCNLSTREQFNLVTHWLDLSQLYGNTVVKSNSLRLFTGGLLNSSHVRGMKYDYLPYEKTNVNRRCQNIDVNKPCFKAGDVRINLNVLLLSFQTVWLREHNRVATSLATINPSWGDELLFQEARKITIAEYQHVVYNEYLPVVVGTYAADLYGLRSQKRGYFGQYSPKLNPNIINEFTTAAFRFDHTLVRSTLSNLDADYRPLGRTLIQNVMFKTSNAFSKAGIDGYIRGTLIDPAQSFDSHVNNYLNNHYYEISSRDQRNFPTAPKKRFSLPALNINRGRDHGLPGYNYYRALCGLNLAKSFTDLWNMPAGVRRKLAKVYDHVNDIDLFTGGTSESPMHGAVVGPTFACIISKQFRDLKHADRFYYENGQDKSTRMTHRQLDQIRSVSLARILCDNVDINYVQTNPFRIPHFQANPTVSCANVAKMDLWAWRADEFGRG